jgi:hypothetical protein
LGAGAGTGQLGTLAEDELAVLASGGLDHQTLIRVAEASFQVLEVMGDVLFGDAHEGGEFPCGDRMGAERVPQGASDGVAPSGRSPIRRFL